LVGVRVGVAVRLVALVGALVGSTFVGVAPGGELPREKLPKLTVPASTWPSELPVRGSSWKKVNDARKITAN
jgi:hypothetical protein